VEVTETTRVDDDLDPIALHLLLLATGAGRGAAVTVINEPRGRMIPGRRL